MRVVSFTATLLASSCFFEEPRLRSFIVLNWYHSLFEDYNRRKYIVVVAIFWLTYLIVRTIAD